MSGKNILEEFFDRKDLAVLKVFLNLPGEKFYLREVAKKAKVPNATTFRIVRKLKAIGVVDESAVKKSKFYGLSQNKATKFLSELFEGKKPIMEEFIETVSAIPGAETILQHGEDHKGKIELIIIGNNLDKKIINEKIGEIKYAHDFTILATIVNSQEFARLVITGGISQKTSIIWQRPTEGAENQV